ncbi:hypothetical protein CHS0354_005292 [Potamilus streckersoni]|uniref:Uncharacterized protein n=1 Tax=Potamilus streckersoni TaxID=2493646 RepID=A0AAE0VVA8_9BIVA|nr:hypothetical protein CHS0354_005292 [Potamilus streckersoni]
MTLETDDIIKNEALGQLSEDDDSEEDSLKAGTLLGLIEVEPYSSCPMSQCKNAKLKTEEKDGKYLLRCHKHGQIVTDDAAELYMYARFHVQTSDGKICNLVAFLPILKLLFEAKSKKLNLTLDKQIIERDISSLLPFPLRYHEKNGKIEGVCFKRAASHLDT